MRILFTGVGRRVELIQAFREAALALNKDLKIYGADLTGTAPALAYCDFTRKVVAMKDPGYIDDLLRVCVDDQIDLLIPTIDTDLLVLSENRDRFEAMGTKVLISAPEMIRICRDKNKTSRFFADCGLCAPMPVNDWREYQSGYPAFIKPKDGSSSINAFKVESQEELQVYVRQVDDYIIQPYVEGKEFTIDVFCDWDGKPVSIVPRERMQVRAGEVLKTRIDLDPRMIEETESLCKAFKPCGPMTVQLIRDNESGDDYYIEINPRYGGGAPLSMKAGARTAEAVLKMLDGEKPECFSDILDGAVYSRFDQSVWINQINGKTRGVVFDLDDTLYSEKEYIRSGYRAVAEYLGNENYKDALWRYFEEGKPAINELLKDIGRSREKMKTLSVYRQHKPEIHLYNGVAELLKGLHHRGIKVGIITDGRPEGQRNKIKALGLEALVDDIIITDELGGTQFRKPCDIAFRIMQNRWRLPAHEMLYVADNAVKDFQAPRQLGMKGLLFDNWDGLYQSNQKDGMASITCITDVEGYIC